jgi:pyruvate/2-oxoglutarate dehydrogenase complex dihydrolipoamide acyltransferase (E2) component
VSKLGDLFHELVDSVISNPEQKERLHAAVDDLGGDDKDDDGGDGVKATPAAQAHAEELGVDLATVPGSGSGGTVTKADVAAVAAPDPTEAPPAEG